jgi:hypothetical protein
MPHAKGEPMSEPELPETYIDSRGAEMPFIGFSEALDNVYELANGNQIDENDITFGDSGLADQRDWQQKALDAVCDFVTNHVDSIDELPPSLKAGDWKDETIKCDRNMDPEIVLNAIKICLEMAETGALDPSEAKSPELADEIDRQQQALDVVRDLIGMHGDNIAQVRNIRLPNSF